MSEIKGQLLGIILVLSVFATIVAVICTAFERSADVISERVEDAAYTNSSKPNPRVNTEYSLHY